MASTFVLDRLPLWAVFAATAAFVLLCIFIGNRLGADRRRAQGDYPEGAIGAVVGAMLGLLAFILAFTFGIASSRFDTRKQLLLDDVNAIATTVHRADLLPEAHRIESHALLKRYVDIRADAMRDPRTLPRGMVEAESLQNRLWAHAVALARADMNSDIGALYVEALNELMAVHRSRTTVALQYRIPAPIWYGLLLVTGLSMLSVGFQFGISGRTSRVTQIGLALAFSAVVFLIALLDRPVGGLTVSQQPMLELQRKLATPE